MDRPVVRVVRTGTANLASVMAGLRRAGAEPELTRDPGAVADSARLVLPGVGALAAAMEELRRGGLADALRRRVEQGLPTLAICLGLQLLAEGSDESPGVEALGIFPGRAERFGDTVRCPQLGWNRITPVEGCSLLRPGHAYFANSYRLLQAPAGWAAAVSDHGGPFIAALERGPVLACQFHPELSGSWGLELLRRWLASGEEVR